LLANRWAFVVCSQSKELKKKTHKWVTDIFKDNAYIFFLEGWNSIFKAYNKAIDISSESKYVCFVHEDIDLLHLDIKALESLLDKPATGFVGAAGAKRLPSNGCWWSGYDGKPNADLSGRAGHQKRDGHKVIRWINEYGPYGPVEVLDGLILFCRRDLLNSIKWDDEYFDGWDYYDISITWEATNRGFINYTFEKMELYHWGLGEHRPGWEENRVKFLKWKETK